MTGIRDLRGRHRATCAAARTSSALMFVKAGWGLAGGVLLLLTHLRTAHLPGGRQHRGRHRRALRRARHRRRPRADGAALDARSVADDDAAGDRAGVLHGRRVLRRARRRAGTLPLAALCVLLRALRRIDPLGVQHRAAADGGARSSSADASSPPSSRSSRSPRRSRATSRRTRSTGWHGRRGRCRSRSVSASPCPACCG